MVFWGIVIVVLVALLAVGYRTDRHMRRHGQRLSAEADTDLGVPKAEAEIRRVGRGDLGGAGGGPNGV